MVGTPTRVVEIMPLLSVGRPLKWQKRLDSKVEQPGEEPRAFALVCQCSATELHLPPATTPQSLINPINLSLARLVGVLTIGLLAVTGSLVGVLTIRLLAVTGSSVGVLTIRLL